MKHPLKVYVWAFLVSYFCSNIAILCIYFFAKLNVYFFKYEMIDSFSDFIFNFDYNDFRLILFMPIILTLAIMVIYFGQKR